MTEHYADDTVTLHHGDALEVARTLPAASVRTIVTSPPYYGLRDYGHTGQYGAETTLADYIARLVALFGELRRVLADDGTVWLNLGDSFNTYAANRGPAKGLNRTRHEALQQVDAGYGLTEKTLGAKQLMGVPWRVAFALQDDGWILRSDIVWAKPNPMPESVTDRPTKAHEYLFLLAKQPRYYYDAAAIAETGRGRSSSSTRGKYADAYATRDTGDLHRTAAGLKATATADHAWETRNRRDVWEIAPASFAGAHFAVMPPDLVRPCILAGSQPGDTVLDPFSGSGTTGAVATYEGRRYVGIDLNAEYLDLSLRTRFAAPPLNFGEELGA